MSAQLSPDNTADPAPESHTAHAHHPEALRLRAAALYSEGLRSPAIAQQLGVSERTVRAWLADARADFYAQHTDCASVGEYLAVAIERKLAIAAAAWQSYHHAVALEQLALDYYHAGLNRTAALKNIEDELPPPPPRPSTAPARFLSVALAAQREASRIGGCYDRPGARAATTLAAAVSVPTMKSASFAATSTATTGPSSSNPGAATPRGLDPADRAAWTSFMARLGLTADYAGPDDLDLLYRSAWESVRRIYRASPPLATPPSPTPASWPPASTPPIPAKTATALHTLPPMDAAAAPRIPNPAETATAPAPAPAPTPPQRASDAPFSHRGEGEQWVRSEPPHAWQHIM